VANNAGPGVPLEGIPLYEVKSMRPYKLIVYGSLAQLLAAFILTPTLLISSTKSSQFTRGFISSVLLSWGCIVAVLTRRVSRSLILKMKLLPSSEAGKQQLQLSSLNLFGKLKHTNIIVNSVETVNEEMGQFVRISINNNTYLLDSTGLILEPTLFQDILHKKANE